jgi:hypothetical protein
VPSHQIAAALNQRPLRVFAQIALALTVRPPMLDEFGLASTKRCGDLGAVLIDLGVEKGCQGNLEPTR